MKYSKHRKSSRKLSKSQKRPKSRKLRKSQRRRKTRKLLKSKVRSKSRKLKRITKSPKKRKSRKNKKSRKVMIGGTEREITEDNIKGYKTMIEQLQQIAVYITKLTPMPPNISTAITSLMTTFPSILSLDDVSYETSSSDHTSVTRRRTALSLALDSSGVNKIQIKDPEGNMIDIPDFVEKQEPIKGQIKFIMEGLNKTPYKFDNRIAVYREINTIFTTLHLDKIQKYKQAIQNLKVLLRENSFNLSPLSDLNADDLNIDDVKRDRTKLETLVLPDSIDNLNDIKQYMALAIFTDTSEKEMSRPTYLGKKDRYHSQLVFYKTKFKQKYLNPLISFVAEDFKSEDFNNKSVADILQQLRYPNVEVDPTLFQYRSHTQPPYTTNPVYESRDVIQQPEGLYAQPSEPDRGEIETAAKAAQRVFRRPTHRTQPAADTADEQKTDPEAGFEGFGSTGYEPDEDPIHYEDPSRLGFPTGEQAFAARAAAIGSSVNYATIDEESTQRASTEPQLPLKYRQKQKKTTQKPEEEFSGFGSEGDLDV